MTTSDHKTKVKLLPIARDLCVCVCVCVCVTMKKSARRMASTTIDAGNTSSK